jgi:hypothetical protein
MESVGLLLDLGLAVDVDVEGVLGLDGVLVLGLDGVLVLVLVLVLELAFLCLQVEDIEKPSEEGLT